MHKEYPFIKVIYCSFKTRTLCIRNWTSLDFLCKLQENYRSEATQSNKLKNFGFVFLPFYPLVLFETLPFSVRSVAYLFWTQKFLRHTCSKFDPRYESKVFLKTSRHVSYACICLQTAFNGRVVSKICDIALLVSWANGRLQSLTLSVSQMSLSRDLWPVGFLWARRDL